MVGRLDFDAVIARMVAWWIENPAGLNWAQPRQLSATIWQGNGEIDILIQLSLKRSAGITPI